MNLHTQIGKFWSWKLNNDVVPVYLQNTMTYPSFFFLKKKLCRGTFTQQNCKICAHMLIFVRFHFISLPLHLNER